MFRIGLGNLELYQIILLCSGYVRVQLGWEINVAETEQPLNRFSCRFQLLEHWSLTTTTKVRNHWCYSEKSNTNDTKPITELLLQKQQRNMPSKSVKEKLNKMDKRERELWRFVPHPSGQTMPLLRRSLPIFSEQQMPAMIWFHHPALSHSPDRLQCGEANRK